MLKNPICLNFLFLFHAVLLLMLVMMPWQVSFAQLAGQFYPEANLSGFPFTITAYGPDNQLPQSEIKSIIKTPGSGELLFSTANGVVVFNGYEMRPHYKETGYRELNYSKLCYHGQYNKALGFNNRGDLFLLETRPEFLGRFGAVDIRENQWAVIDSLGSLTFAEHKADAKTVFKTGITNPGFLEYLGNGKFLISDQSYTYLFSLATHEKQVLMREAVVAGKSDAEMDKAYLLTRSKMYLYDQSGISEIFLTDNKDVFLKDLEVVDHKAIIISNLGMFVVSEAGVEMYSENDVLPTNSLNSIYYETGSGCLFVGTGNKGLLKLQKKLFENFYQKKSLFFGSFSSVVPYKGNRFYVAGAKSILQLSPGKPLTAMDMKASFSTLSVYNDTLFAGTWGYGLYLFSTVDNRVLAHIPINDRNIHAVLRDSKGVYWVGTSAGVLKGRDIMRLKGHLPGKITMRVTTICETKNGNIWMGGSEGVTVLDKNGNISLRFDKANGISAVDVRSFYEDVAGKVWIGTYGGGLYCYTGDKLVSLAQKPGYMLGDDAFSLARDAYGYILITTNHGLQAVHEDALNRFLDDSVAYLIPFQFGTQSGILNPEFNGGFLNNYATSDRLNFYFPSVQGIVRYQSEPFKRNENMLKITEVLVDNLVVGKPYSMSRQIQYLQFVFGKVVFSQTANMYYQYKLVFSGNDTQWSKPQKSTSITFSYLKPGEYHLLIRAIDAFNDPGPAFVSYDFYIEPYFYERIGFRISMLLIFIILAAAITRYRLIKQKQKSEKELELKLTFSELQLKSIQAQMNPHFIFNSMNVLVQLISSQKPKKAEDFAISFSKLLRNILEQSDKNFITVKDEIKTLRSYLDIHLIRFEKSFTYTINCPDELLPLQIPTMLLQPMIENAILHGIAHADHPCELSIGFSLENAVLFIEVRDNGIGHAHSGEINSSLNHKPLGIELIRRKIALLRIKYNIQVELSVDDLDTVAHTGTVVLFKISQL
jgi:hypothetical protein